MRSILSEPVGVSRQFRRSGPSLFSRFVLALPGGPKLPAKIFRLGSIKAAVWENQADTTPIGLDQKAGLCLYRTE